MKRFFDHVQLFFHLAGFHAIATFFGRWGTPAVYVDDIDIHDRPTLPVPIITNSVLVTPDYSLDDLGEVGPLKMQYFDPTFNGNLGIDVAKDVAFPTSKKEIN